MSSKIVRRLILLAALSLSACSFEANVTKNSRSSESDPPTIVISPAIGSNSSAVPISGICPPSAANVTVSVSSGPTTGIACSNGNYSGTLDLSTLPDGTVTIIVSTPAASTSGVTIKDSVAPSAPTALNDGTTHNSITHSPPITYSAGTDTGSGISKHQVRIVRVSDSTVIADWADHTSGNAVMALTLVDAINYRAEARAVDLAGNISATTQGDGWLADLTAPLAATSFLDGVMSFSNTDSPIMSWLAGNDAGSGLAGYEISIGTASGETDVLNWIGVGNVLTTALSTLTLSGSTKYFASLRSLDNAGNRSTAVNSDSWYNFKQSKLAVDNTNPQARWLSYGANFGRAIAISEDQTTMVVGALFDDTDAVGGNYDLNIGAAFVYVKSGGSWLLQQKLIAEGTNSRTLNDLFGSSVAISGDTIVVGAHQQDFDSSGDNELTDAGAAYVFTRSGTTWTQQQKLVGQGVNGRVAGDHFGSSIAITGDTLAIGAEWQDFDEVGENELAKAGAIFVFKRTSGTWVQEQKIVPSLRGFIDYFGSEIAIDQNTIVAGVRFHDYNASGGGYLTNAGAAYIFFRTGSVWAEQQKIVGTGTNGRMDSDFFGSSVSISGDTVVIGASGQDYNETGAGSVSNSGAAFVFTRTLGTWSLQQKLVPSGTNARMIGDGFGSNLKLDGDTVAIQSYSQGYDENGANLVSGAGAVFVFTRIGTNWTQDQKLVGTGTNGRLASDYFGSSLALRGDALAAGSANQDYDTSGNVYISDAGAAYTFTRASGTWTPGQKVVDEVVPANRLDLMNNFFGNSIAISEDGTTMVVGSPSDDTDESGGNYSSGAGAAYVYIKTAGSWILQQKIIASGLNARMANDSFGISVGISGDTVVVGAHSQSYDASGANLVGGAGAAYVYTRSGSTWTQQQKLIATGPNARIANDRFGYRVAIDGETMAVGAFQHTFDESGGNSLPGAGAVFVFTRTGTNWTQEQKLVGTGTNGRLASDYFGSSVSISGDSLAIGAYGQDYDESGNTYLTLTGATYVYIRTGLVWSLEQKLVATGTNARTTNDFFGYSVAISGNTLVAGAYQHEYDATGETPQTTAGAAFVFTRSGSTWTQQQKLVAEGTNARVGADNFAYSVAINKDTIGVGAYKHDWDAVGADARVDAGAVFIFTRSGTTWTQQLKLSPTGTNSRVAGDGFGAAVCIYEDSANKTFTIGIGAPNQDFDSSGATPSDGAGAVYIYH